MSVAYVSTLGEELRRRGITIADLQRRLAARGLRVSRRAIDRIVSDRPIAMVSLSTVLPILDELRMPFEDAFRSLSTDDEDSKRRARARAARLLAGSPARAAFSPEVEAELDDAIARSAAILRTQRPDLFDARGRPRRRALMRALEEQLGSRRYATEAEYAALTSPPELSSSPTGAS